MFHVYAIDPHVLSSWERLRYFLDSLGHAQGRLLAEFPKTWKRLVYDCLRQRGTLTSRVELRLKNMDATVFVRRPQAAYDGTCSWLENALEEHAREPFHAIVANATEGIPNATEGTPAILDADAVDATWPLWRASAGLLVPRDSEEMASVAAPLLCLSTRMVWIDPYFWPEHHNKTDVLKRVLEATRLNADVEIHARLPEDFGYPWAKSRCEQLLPQHTPSDLKLRVRFRAERDCGKRLHNRYVLTDVGGIQFGDGLEKGSVGQDDRVSALEAATWKELLNQYCEAPSAFDDVGDPIMIHGTRAR